MEISINIKKSIKSKIIVSEKIDFKNEIGKFKYDRAVIVTDKKIFKVFKDKINIAPSIAINSDRTKEFDEIKEIIKFFIKNKMTRNSLAIAVGGGKISDITGFASSIYLRGIRWISIPTTLLAQIDASIGGKTAIDFEAKNIIGSFHNPFAILIDPSLVISRKENLNEAMGEIIKYAIIADKNTSKNLQKLTPLIKKDFNALKKAIILCVKLKSKMVSKDPFDEKGIREKLNFGHTAAHAIETIYKIPHGNAVSLGIKFAVKLSRELNLINLDNYRKLSEIIKYDGFKTKLNKKDFEYFLKLVSKDKKNKGFSNYFLLINDKMELKGFKNIKEKIIWKIWEELCEEYS
ncbi:MAG: 3-dehydroquinate synthase family protein [Elusimicrobiota bacterium]